MSPAPTAPPDDLCIFLQTFGFSACFRSSRLRCQRGWRKQLRFYEATSCLCAATPPLTAGLAGRRGARKLHFSRMFLHHLLMWGWGRSALRSWSMRTSAAAPQTRARAHTQKSAREADMKFCWVCSYCGACWHQNHISVSWAADLKCLRLFAYFLNFSYRIFLIIQLNKQM